MQPGPDANTTTGREAPAARADGRDFIAENLRRMFGAVETEELPDRFRALLDRLAEEERGR